MLPELHVASDLALPIEAVTQTIAILGNRGTGKTNTAVVGTEELLKAGQQVIVVDPLNVWWGLKSSKDGESAGFPVLVMGGPKGDVPLPAESGAAVADFLVRNRVSAVLSLRHVSKGKAREFVTSFAEHLFALKGEPRYQTPVQVVLDECDQFVPQKVMGESARMVGAIDALVRQGRSSGIGVVLISQRAAVVNWDVLSQVEILFAHRHTSPPDRKALDGWVKAHDTEGRREEFLSTIATLARGEAWVWSPEWLDIFRRVRIRERETFDSSRTPKVGETILEPVAFAQVDLEALKAAMAESIDLAASEDPKALKAEIARLKKAGSAEVTGYTEADVARAVEAATAPLNLQIAHLSGALTSLRSSLRAVLSNVDEAERTMVRNAEKRLASSEPHAAVSTIFGPSPDKPKDERISVPQQAILNTLANLAVIGLEHPRKDLAALFSGASPTSSAFTNNLGRLRATGLIDYPASGIVALTSEGHKVAVTSSAPLTLAEFRERWYAILSKPQANILRALLASERSSHHIHKPDLASKVNASPKSSAFTNNLGRLRSLGLIDYGQGGVVFLTSALFPEGLR